MLRKISEILNFEESHRIMLNFIRKIWKSFFIKYLSITRTYKNRNPFFIISLSLQFFKFIAYSTLFNYFRKLFILFNKLTIHRFYEV